jgi:hypothetical protein
MIALAFGDSGQALTRIVALAQPVKTVIEQDVPNH